MQIFLSYAEQDVSFASELTTTLKQHGAKVWFDQNDAPQNDQSAWESTVRRALHDSDVLITILSFAALQQEYVVQDWQQFITDGRPVVAVVIEDVEVPETLRRRGTVLDFFHHQHDNSNLHRLQMVLLDIDARLATNKWRLPPSED